MYIQPRASRNEVVGLHGDAIKVRLTAPPVDGAANQALVVFLARYLGVTQASIRLAAGETSRRKCVEITADSAKQLLEIKSRLTTPSKD